MNMGLKLSDTVLQGHYVKGTKYLFFLLIPHHKFIAVNNPVYYFPLRNYNQLVKWIISWTES